MKRILKGLLFVFVILVLIILFILAGFGIKKVATYQNSNLKPIISQIEKDLNCKISFLYSTSPGYFDFEIKNYTGGEYEFTNIAIQTCAKIYNNREKLQRNYYNIQFTDIKTDNYVNINFSYADYDAVIFSTAVGDFSLLKDLEGNIILNLDMPQDEVDKIKEEYKNYGFMIKSKYERYVSGTAEEGC
jgi:hypothetical protein